MSPFKMGHNMGLLVCRPFLIPNPEGCAHAVSAQQLLPGSAALPQSHSGGDRPSDMCHPTAQPSLARTAAAPGARGHSSCLLRPCHQQDSKPGKATSNSSKGFVDEEQPQLPLLAPAPGWARRQQTLFEHLGWEPLGPDHPPVQPLLPTPSPGSTRS